MVKVFRAYRGLTESEQRGAGHRGVSLTMKEEHSDTPVITMSMSPTGVISRICGQLVGSCVTFGTAGKASAPGQIPANLLSTFLQTLA